MYTNIQTKHFNSIKVRLKRLRHQETSPYNYHFNSIKVRLKHVSFDVTVPKERHFNSIKVRLKLPKLKCVDSPKEFQFHKGTIKTFSLHSETYTDTLFQFHKGTIKTS